MFEGMKVMKYGDLAVGAAACAILGAAAGAAALDYARTAVAQAAPRAPARAPTVERQDASGAVLVFHAQIEGREAVCRLTITHRTRTWSLAC